VSDSKEKSLSMKDNNSEVENRDHKNEKTTSQSSVDQGRTVSVQTVVSVILLVVILIFALINTQEVSINLLLLTVELPLFLVIIVSFLAGGIAALLTSRNKKRKKKKE